ncbi:3-hydroxyacyl-CoA dehydrogenase [bacterium]|nr:3-hydroxyacyl-CoA dehydrogenase [bacterium]
MEIRTVLILGAGTMGQMISLLCAEQGYKVHIYDIIEKSLKNAQERISRIAKKKAVDLLSHVTFYSNPKKAAEGVDLISESVPEDPELKGKVFQEFHTVCSSDTIFTSNTSSLLPSQFAEASGRSERLCALHFHDIRVTKIVDVMPHEGTTSEVIQIVTDFVRSIGQIPIVLKRENNGYVFNNMLMSFLASALTLAQKGVTSIEEIDKSWMGVMHTTVGPFAIMDSIGLETVWKITDYWAEKKDDRQAKANAAFLKSYIDQGKIGQKSGKGFYQYPNPTFKKPDFLS